MRLAYDALFCMTNADRIAYGGTTLNSMKTGYAYRPCQVMDIENESKQSIT